MKWLYRNLYRDKEGFTLVELMIVIIILAILTGIAVPSYMVLRDRARIAAAQSELKNIATAIEMYFADKSEVYPDTTFAAMEVQIEGGGYMNNVPTEDPWDEDYIYLKDTPAGGYTLYSAGPNKTDDTHAGDDIVIVSGELQQ